MIDFNKLDDYKVALDDELAVGQKPSDGMKGDNTDWIVLWKEKGFYYMEVGNSKKEHEVKETDWEEFKIKVADYFLGVGSNEN